MSKENDGKDPSKKRDFNEAFDSDELEEDSMAPSPPDSGASSASAGGSSSEGNVSPASSDSGAAGSSPGYIYEPPIGPPPNQKAKYRAAKIRAQVEIEEEFRAQEAQDRIIGHNSEEYDTAEVDEAQARSKRRRRVSRVIDFESPPPPANCKPGRGPGRGGGGGDDSPPPPAPLGGGGNGGGIVV